MGTYLSHWHAAKYHGIPFLETFFPKKVRPYAQTDVTVFDKRLLRKREGFKLHYFAVEEGEERCFVSHDLRSVSVPLVVYQLASELSVIELIVFCSCVCAQPNGSGWRPVATPGVLRDFAQGMSGHHGQGKVLRALQYVQQGSRSAVETLLMLLLALPYMLGGYGMAGAVFNYKIVLDDAVYYADISWPEKKVMAEYNSAEHHSTPEELGRDARRRARLERAGWCVIDFEQADVYVLERFLTKGRELARALDHRIRIRTAEYAKSFAEIRALLPRDDLIHYRSREQLQRAEEQRIRELVVYLRKLRVPGA